MKRQLVAQVLLTLLLMNSAGLLASENAESETVTEEKKEESGETVEAQAEPTSQEKEKKWWQEPQLFGDFNGGRTEMIDRGLNLRLYYNSFVGVKAKGGVSPREGALTKHSGSIDFFLQADFGKMNFIPGGGLLMQVKNNHGKNINPFVGAISDPIDDADFYDPIYIDQLYYQQTFMKNKGQVRAGYLDLQTIIDRNAFANSEDVQFMTTFLDNNNAMIPLKIGLGATLFLYPTNWLALTAGVIDADNKIRHAGWETTFDGFDSLMVYAEAGLKPEISSSRGPLVGNYRIGVLHDPRNKQIFSTSDLPEPVTKSGDAGVYVSFDQMLVPEEPNSNQGLGAFFRWGRRTADVNKLTNLWSTGLQYRGLFKGRDKDLMGFGTYSVYGSRDYQEYVDPEFDRETGYEIYYSFQVTPWLTFTPDFQYIDNPGAKESIEDAVVFVFRTRFTF